MAHRTDKTVQKQIQSRARNYGHTNRPARNCTIRLWHLATMQRKTDALFSSTVPYDGNLSSSNIAVTLWCLLYPKKFHAFIITGLQTTKSSGRVLVPQCWAIQINTIWFKQLNLNCSWQGMYRRISVVHSWVTHDRRTMIDLPYQPTSSGRVWIWNSLLCTCWWMNEFSDHLTDFYVFWLVNK